MTIKDDNYFMEEAMKEARQSLIESEVPVGAVIVFNGEIIGRGRNQRKATSMIYSHAEINAMAEAEKKVGSWQLQDCTIYTTLEPCPMCSYAIIDSHIKRVVYGAIDEKRGAISTLDIFNKNLGYKVETCVIIKEESQSLLKKFFIERR